MKLTNPDLIRSITSEWKGERDRSGRPLVDAGIIKRMEAVTSEEAWGTLRRNGYHHNFAGDFHRALIRESSHLLKLRLFECVLDRNALNDSRSVPDEEKVNLALGAAVVEPPADGDHLSGVVTQGL